MGAARSTPPGGGTRVAGWPGGRGRGAPGTVLPLEDYTEGDPRRSRERAASRRRGALDDVVRALSILVESDVVTGETVVDGGRLLL